MAERIKRSGVDIRQHWNHLIAKLDRKLAKGAHYDPVGYSYFLRGNVKVVRIANAFITVMPPVLRLATCVRGLDLRSAAVIASRMRFSRAHGIRSRM